MNWYSITEQLKTNQQLATDLMCETILTAEELHQPLKVLKIRNDQPWMNHSIKQLIRKRQRLFREKKRSEYTSMAKKVNTEIHKQKRVYYRRKFPAKNPSGAFSPGNVFPREGVCFFLSALAEVDGCTVSDIAEVDGSTVSDIADVDDCMVSKLAEVVVFTF